MTDAQHTTPNAPPKAQPAAPHVAGAQPLDAVVPGDLSDAVARKGSFWGTVLAVAWSFFGVRRGKDYENDVAKLNPVHVIVAGLIMGVLFVLGLVLLVRWVIATGVAA